MIWLCHCWYRRRQADKGRRVPCSTWLYVLRKVKSLYFRADCRLKVVIIGKGVAKDSKKAVMLMEGAVEAGVFP
jgi:hypothetical protein